MTGGTAAGITRILKPRSVAIVGASDKPGALGATLLSNLERAGFAGDIHLVNPKRAAIGSRACVPSIEALPEGVDVAVLAIPRAGVLDAVRALAAGGAGGAVIFSSGFAEGGPEGLADQQEIARIAADAGMAVIGPNCLGATNYVDRVPLTFAEVPLPEGDATRRIGIVSQSGAMAVVLGVTLMSRALPLSYSISTGNECATGVEDYVEYLLEDDHTAVIAMIVEQFRAPRRFLELAARAEAAGKRIVLLHPGRSGAARESAATHTGAMAGDHAVMRTLVSRAGVILAETLEELGDIVDILFRSPVPPRAGTAVIAESGAFKALTLDFCEEIGLDLPVLDDGNAPLVRAAMPDFVAVANPLDVTAQGLIDPGMYGRLIEALMRDDRFGLIVLAIIQTDPVTCDLKFPPMLEVLRRLTFTKAVVFAGLDEGAVVPPAYVEALRAAGVAWFPTTERVLRAAKRLADASLRDAAAAEPMAATALDPPAGTVPEYRSKALLARIGIPFPDGRFATSADEAVAGAEQIGYPVVLKAQSPELSHKSDAGGVILNIADADALGQAWVRLHANVTAYDAAIVLDGALVEPMGARGVELIVGARRDPDWGPVILVGMGGVMAELLHDVRLLPPDLPRDAIVRELRRLKGAALFAGFRGAPQLDIDAVADIVLKLGRLLLDEPRIREIDLNPVIAYPRGAVALDALMLVDDAG